MQCMGMEKDKVRQTADISIRKVQKSLMRQSLKKR